MAISGSVIGCDGIKDRGRFVSLVREPKEMLFRHAHMTAQEASKLSIDLVDSIRQSEGLSDPLAVTLPNRGG